ncbi:MAG: dihydropteroate synthase [Verrucomicrobiales bacterium]|nr:dihydropteroate synthase [Verrucomicrobiales bacterium]
MTMRWKALNHEWTFPRPALLMGIVNVTPDSFSDGGCFLSPADAIRHALTLEAEGAEIIDIGGESTRPGAAPVTEAEELRRVLPVIEGLAGRLKAAISIDTRKATVARAAVLAGASIVNDVGAASAGTDMLDLVATTGVGYVCMHMQGSPDTMQAAPRYRDVVAEVRAFLAERLRRLTAAGIRTDQVVVDPGIGFGKTLEHNLALLAALKMVGSSGRPLLLGASRKSFISNLLGVKPEDRLPGSLACAVWAVEQGVQILRIHDVAATHQAIRMHEAMSTKLKQALRQALELKQSEPRS